MMVCRFARLLWVIGVCGLMLGCACIDTCRPSSGVAANSLQRTLLTEAHEKPNRARMTVSDDVSSHVFDSKGLGDLAIGSIISQLRLLVEDLEELVQTTSGEIKSIVIQTQASASQLAAELDQRFKDRTNLLVKQLSDLERQTANDAFAAINSMQAAVNSARQAADESALTAMQEASIVTYDALFDLPCRDRTPRIVYGTPREARIWKDAPGEGANKRTLSFKLRGNYVAAFGTPKVFVKDRPINVTGSNNNEIYLELPDALITELQDIQHPTNLVFNVELQACGRNVQKQSVAVLVKPPITYMVFARIAPTVTLPYDGKRTYSFDETGGCDSHYRVDRLWPVGPPEKIVSWKVRVKHGNCGSNIVSIYPQGEYNLKVDAMIHGCGRDCIPFIGVCNCRGRGKLEYEADISYSGLRPAPLPPFEPPAATGAQLTYAFPYTPGLPAERDPSLTQCDYYVRASVNEGASARVVELTNSIPQAPGFVSRVNPNTCDVSVQVDQPTSMRLNKVEGLK